MPIEPIFNIAEIDLDLATHLPPGWLGILSSTTGAGTGLLAKQFAHAGGGRAPVNFYTTWEQAADVARAFRDFGWDPDAVNVGNLASEYYERVLAQDLEIARVRDRGLSFSELRGAPARPVVGRSYHLAGRLLSDLAAMDSRFRLVLDSLDFLLDLLPPETVLTLARQVRHCAQSLGGQAFLVIRPDIHERRVVGALEDLADVVIDVNSRAEDGGYNLLVGVRKVRNHPELTRSHRMVVTNAGISLAPKGE